MKSDLRDSTPLYKSLAESELSRVLHEQKQLFSRLVQQHEGHLVKGEGDAFWVTFPSVTAAVEVAIAIQQELKEQQTGKISEGRVAVRIVISLGDVLHQGNDIFGYAVNLVSRIEGVTPADEIYLSEVARLALNEAEIETSLVGEFTFKGVAQPEKVYRVAQPHRTRLLRDQTIVVTDLRYFAAYQQHHTVADVERLLIHIEKTVRAATEAQGGTIRYSIGDTYCLTFSEPALALTAVDEICRTWQAYIQETRDACPIIAGIHQGDLAMFRAYLYGEAITRTFRLQQFGSALHPYPSQNCVVVSGRVYDLVAGTVWQERLRQVQPDEVPDLAESLAERPVYELDVMGDA
jgi:class 3 adenylate cyclase